MDRMERERYFEMVKEVANSLLKRQLTCKHVFVHVAVTSWFAMRTTIYCKKCGVDKDV